MQHVLAGLVISPGKVPFDRWRAFKSAVRQEEEPHRFVDGELIEQYLHADEELQEVVAEKLKGTTLGDSKEQVDAEWLRNMVEGLRRLH